MSQKNKNGGQNTYSWDTDDSDDDSTSSMEHPGSMQQELLTTWRGLTKILSEKYLSELQKELDTVKTMTKDLEDFHRKATYGSLAGGVVGAVGGCLSVAGAAMAPFTLGTSLSLTAVGSAVGAAGSLTGITSNTMNMANQTILYKKITAALETFENKISSIAEYLQKMKLLAEKMAGGDSVGAAILTNSVRKVLIHLAVLDSLKNLDLDVIRRSLQELIKLLAIEILEEAAENTGKVAARVAAKGVKTAAAFSGAVSGVFAVFDIISAVKDAKELDEMNKPLEDSKSNTVKLIKHLRDITKSLQEVLNELKKTLMSN